jgi:hypothetical protein
MAKIVQGTREGRREFETDDPEVIRRAENDHTDDTTGVMWTQVTDL